MPVQINEMVIRANIIEADEKKTASSNSSQSEPAVNKEDIIKECVAIVLELIDNKNQR